MKYGLYTNERNYLKDGTSKTGAVGHCNHFREVNTLVSRLLP